MQSISPFHAGEKQVQERLGVRELIEPWARQAIRPFMPDQHRDFYTMLPFVVGAARDLEGQPWVTLLEGNEGFLKSPAPEVLTMDTYPHSGDPLHGALREGSELGLLGIDLATRRRNRVNGRVARANENARTLEFSVDQSFGNCPQYIHARQWHRVSDEVSEHAIQSAAFTSTMRAWIEQSDTLFIASGHRGAGEAASYGMDASHRGGEPGFVHVLNDKTLVIPDYAGNNHYNTIGNLVMDSRAGLTFVDFDHGGLLQLTGTISVQWDGKEVERYPGARRLLVFTLSSAVQRERALALRWRGNERAVRTLRVVERTQESADVVSITFEARDGGPLPAFEAGQHLPIELPNEFGKSLERTYSLSGDPAAKGYRISVRRQPGGVVSNLVHDALQPGVMLNASDPGGEFVVSNGDTPIVLLGAGVGITPLLAMVYGVAGHAPAQRSGGREVWLVHGVRDTDDQLFVQELAALRSTMPNLHVHTAFSRLPDDDQDSIAGDFSHGRIDATLVRDVVGHLDADFYLCGPPAFMASLSDGLTARGVSESRLHMELFGPAAL
jgi:ferredoxin-NADP reductase/predicted pyridoxine 5'-phosphate oxidase superfamily flavin-nucleotide-binding protein